MIALQITSLKQFMHHLLTADTFDGFLLEEAAITTANTFTIDGRIHPEFFTANGETDPALCGMPVAADGTPYEFRPWKDCKGICFQLIKGKHTPLFFRFVLHLMPEKANALLSRNCQEVQPSLVKALALNIRYDGTHALLTTGTSYHTFLLSKEPDSVWDKALCQFLDSHGIAYDLLDT